MLILREKKAKKKQKIVEKKHFFAPPKTLFNSNFKCKFTYIPMIILKYS